MIVIFILIKVCGTNYEPSITWSFTPKTALVILSSPAVADVVAASPGSEIIFATAVVGENVYCVSSDGHLLWWRILGQWIYTYFASHCKIRGSW